jgi:SAM-dependent methyltransferase
VHDRDDSFDAASVAPDVAAELTAAMTRTMRSLAELTTKCHEHGVDPMAMVMTAMSRMRALQDAPPSAIVASPEATTHAEIVQRSRHFVFALDCGDTEAVEPMLAPGFVHFVGGPATDRDTVLTRMRQRTSKVPYFATRTWEQESVVPNGETLIFSGKAHEIQGGNDTHGGYLFDGWYVLQWVRDGAEWRVQFLNWSRESTDRDWWNNIFLTGRGFTLEPNRLLVETVECTTPGAALDLAAGQGRNALHLASRGWQVIAVDVSDEGLRIARAHAIKRELAVETINADLDQWDFGTERFDLVTLLYAGDHAKWMAKIRASLRVGGLILVEGWAKTAPDSDVGFTEGQLAELFEGYEILRDEIVDDVPDWAWDKGKLVRFVARKR